MAEENRDSLFFTTEGAVSAVQRDFCQYPPQEMLFRELLRLIFGPDMIMMKYTGEEGLWLRMPQDKKMRRLSGDELAGHMCEVVAAAADDLSLLAAICTRVFRTRASVSSDPPGIIIETEMERFSCHRCGHCCRDLDYSGAFTEADYRRLAEAGREDILEKVAVYRQKDGSRRFRIWVHADTRTPEAECPFLEHRSSRNRWRCRIHDVRPEICRQYPTSRKHAEMTGCPGFSGKR